MFDEPTAPATRRHLIDGSYALLLLAIAIVTGYLILAPSDLRAIPLARPLPEPRPGLVTDRSRPAVPPRRPVEVVLRPHVVKAAYLTYFGVGDRTIRNRLLDLTAHTELNAVVIDVKGDRGWIVYPTSVIEAIAAGARGPGTLRDFD